MYTKVESRVFAHKNGLTFQIHENFVKLESSRSCMPLKYIQHTYPKSNYIFYTTADEIYRIIQH